MTTPLTQERLDDLKEFLSRPQTVCPTPRMQQELLDILSEVERLREENDYIKSLDYSHEGILIRALLGDLKGLVGAFKSNSEFAFAANLREAAKTWQSVCVRLSELIQKHGGKIE